MNALSISAASPLQHTADPGEVRDRADVWNGNIQDRIPADELRRLSVINEFRSAFGIAGEWFLIVAAVWLCSHYWNPVLYVVTVMWIGARQHALTILMHDGAHYRFCRRKAVNDFISDCLLAWPMFATTRAYRATHFAHHRFINTTEDPDWMRKRTVEWEFPKSWRNLAVMLLRDVTGLNTRELLSDVSDVSKAPKGGSGSLDIYIVARTAYYIVVLSLLIYFHWLGGFLLYWIVPITTWFKVISRIRSIAEHFGIDENAYALSRTTLPSPLEKLFVAPKNVNFHLEHHLYPSVPFYRLPQLHKLLMSTPGYRERAHITQTYWGVLKECCAAAPQGTAPS